MTSYCCTCAAPLSAGIPISPTAPVTSTSDAKTASPPQHRMLPCCDRFVCSRCLAKNARFATYCPYCQIATAPPPSSSSTSKQSKASAAASTPSKDLLPPGLKAPPPYRRFGAGATTSADQPSDEAPPPYSSNNNGTNVATAAPPSSSSNEKDAGPILHYLDHDRDSIASLSLRYNVPADLLRQANRLTADHLLQARRVIQIPSSSNTPLASLSPQPVESEGEGRRKAAIRRFMVACKVADYDLAVLYLEQTGWRTDTESNELEYDLRAAVEAYQADEQWEKTHPVEAAKQKAERQKKNKNKSSGSSGSRIAGGFFSRLRS